MLYRVPGCRRLQSIDCDPAIILSLSAIWGQNG
jgi:hypothetical protein